MECETTTLSVRDKEILYEFVFAYTPVPQIAENMGTTQEEILQTLTEIVDEIQAEIDFIKGEG